MYCLVKGPICKRVLTKIIYDFIFVLFLFCDSLINKKNAPIRIPCTDPSKAITSHSNSGPTFGDGHEFYISDHSNIKDPNTKLLSCSNVGATYKHPAFSFNTHDSKTFLAGSFLFQTMEVEVFATE